MSLSGTNTISSHRGPEYGLTSCDLFTNLGFGDVLNLNPFGFGSRQFFAVRITLAHFFWLKKTKRTLDYPSPILNRRVPNKAGRGAVLWNPFCSVDTLLVVVYSPKLCPTLVTPWTVACQAPLFMGFSRQEYWSGLPFPSPEKKDILLNRLKPCGWVSRWLLRYRVCKCQLESLN